MQQSTLVDRGWHGQTIIAAVVCLRRRVISGSGIVVVLIVLGVTVEAGVLVLCRRNGCMLELHVAFSLY